MQQAMRPFMKNDNDWGAPGAQVMAAHMKVQALQRHIKENKGDKHSKHSYMLALSHRHKLVKYFRRKDPALYFEYLRKTGQKDVMMVK